MDDGSSQSVARLEGGEEGGEAAFAFSRHVAFPIWTSVGVSLLCAAGGMLAVAHTHYDPLRWYVGCGVIALCGVGAVGVGTFARFRPMAIPSPIMNEMPIFSVIL